MHFLYPNILWGLLALFIPIIIHFFNFRKYTTVYFSNTIFLQNLKKDTKSKSTLKNILILLSRILALTFLILVFAHPYINDKKIINTTSNTIIYIDNSFSMEAEGKYGVLLESAKIKAKEIAEQSVLNTKFMLITNDFEQQHQRFVDKEQFVEWLSQIKTSHIVTAQNEILHKISAIIKRDTNINYNLFILSDFQTNTINSNKIDINDNVNIVAIPFKGQLKQNLYIDTVWFETPGHYKGKQEKLHIKIKNTTKDFFVDVPIKLFINDSLKTSLIFSIKKIEKEIIIPFTIWDTGYFKAKITIDDYPITFDNTLYFNFEIREKSNILIIGDKKTFTPYNALYKDDKNTKSQTVSIKHIKYNNFNNYQVIILNELVNLSTGLISQLYKYVNSGGDLVIIPNVNGNIDTYNTLLKKLNGISYGDYVEQEGNVTNINLNDLIFKSVFKSNISNSKLPEYKGFFNIKIPQKVNEYTIFKTEYGTPLFIRGIVGKGQYYLSGMSFDEKYSNFTTHPLFVPLFYNITLYSTQVTSLYYRIKTGLYCELARTDKVVESLYMTNKITEEKIKPNYHQTMNSLVVYPQINKLTSGSYEVYTQNGFYNYLSFNYNTKESEIKYYNISEVEKVYKENFGVDIEIIKQRNKNKIKRLLKEHNGHSLINIFLWGVLLFLIIEMVLLRFFK